MKRRYPNKRIIAMAFFLCVLVVFVFSNVYIIIHAGHCYTHSVIDRGCEACVQLQQAEKNLRQFSVAFIGALLVIAGSHVALLATKTLTVSLILSTPITSKARMNN